MSEPDPKTRELARELGELRLLWLDMSQARALFERLAEMPDAWGDFRLASSLWTSGLIAYRRCFSGGKGLARGRSRAPIPQGFVDALEPEQRELHDDSLLMADRQIARRVTDHHGVEVWLEVEHGPPPRVRSVRARHIMAPARTHNAFELAALTKYLADQIEHECRRVETEIVASANSSDVASWFIPTAESPEWVNLLSAGGGPNVNDMPTKIR
jgi:hypothetical protein